MKSAKPDWIKAKALSDKVYSGITSILDKHSLHTVCQEALCPNINECWSAKTATFLLMGNICTRNCKFCSVKSGNPQGILDKNEPYNIAKAVKDLDLKYAVLTSVDRDDLEDGGAEHFASTIREIKTIHPKIKVEALIPDFNANIGLLEKIVQAKPDVIGHNIETVKRLTPKVRDKRSGYEKSLDALNKIKQINPHIITKSSLQLGFGEEYQEIVETFTDLINNKIDILTIGQYLQPGPKQLPVKAYIEPEKYREYQELALKFGFLYVVSSPLARSSYKASEYFIY